MMLERLIRIVQPCQRSKRATMHNINDPFLDEMLGILTVYRKIRAISEVETVASITGCTLARSFLIDCVESLPLVTTVYNVWWIATRQEITVCSDAPKENLYADPPSHLVCCFARWWSSRFKVADVQLFWGAMRAPAIVSTHIWLLHNTCKNSWVQGSNPGPQMILLGSTWKHPIFFSLVYGFQSITERILDPRS